MAPPTQLLVQTEVSVDDMPTPVTVSEENEPVLLSAQAVSLPPLTVALPQKRKLPMESLDDRLDVPCKFFAQASCKYGATCYFKHELSTALEAPSEANFEVCKFFSAGMCKYGAACFFAHRSGVSEAIVSIAFENSSEDKSAFVNGRWRSRETNSTRGRKKFCTSFSSALMLDCCGDTGDLRCSLHVPSFPPASALEDAGHKTALCAAFIAAAGSCKAGEACRDAHGVAELVTPRRFKEKPGYKRAMCSWHKLKGPRCDYEAQSHLCFDAHGASDLRRGLLDGDSTTLEASEAQSGDTLKCVSSCSADVWRSLTDYDVIGEIAPGCMAKAAGPAEIVHGFLMVPILPQGAVEARYFGLLAPDGGRRNPAQLTRGAPFLFSDAHVHLDAVLLSRRYGPMWLYKTRPCRHNMYTPCSFGKEGCVWSHSDDDALPRPPIDINDLTALAADMKSIAGGTFAGCVHSCCGIDSIDDTLRLVEWGRQVLGGRIYASFGIHPTDFEEYTPEVEARLEAALEACGDCGVAWGECGLDYNKLACEFEKKPELRDRMRAVFVRQASVAVSRGLPLVVHSRDAVGDTLAVLRERVPRTHPVHMHSFFGSVAELEEFLAFWPQGYVGITGAITWPVAKKPGGLAEVVRALPLGRMLLETDGPFMAPVPFRGEESHPGVVPWIAAVIADIKGVTILEVLTTTHQNFCSLYSPTSSQVRPSDDSVGNAMWQRRRMGVATRDG
eukprot:TRINITY_DN16257_c0_g1_i1.p1 TRINITY_DN16257_c0_g1~~TRINITY_DN16257_c0_g1_i1.p1  ORF type:complete len:728 (-),score=127.03 TRINITY_DN16257_c0_g1_i1:190-2373(-)